MPKAVLYAMEPAALQAYIDHKNAISAAAINLSDEQISKIRAEVEEYRFDGRELYTVDSDGNAHIAIAGPLEPKPDICAVLFDIEMTTYADIIKGIEQAEADESVKTIIFDIDSPGGNVVGLTKTADKIRTASKPTRAVVLDMAASAAYWLASQTDSLEAENESIEVGSIGVVTEYADYSESDKQRGVKRYIITSENAPDKRLDVTNDSDRAKIVTRITKLETVFIDYVAAGRNTTPDNVKENYGKGGVLIARDALSAGMIDRIISTIDSPDGITAQGKPADRKTTATETTLTGDNTMGDITMTEEQLNALVEGAASKAAAAAVAGVDEKLEARDKANAAENKRKAGFQALLTKYPEQSKMINEEMAKDGAEATAEFAISVADAETGRLAALKEQEEGSEEGSADGAQADGHQAKDESGNMLAASLGLKIGGAK